MTDDAGQPVTLTPRAARSVPLTRTQTLIWASQRLLPDVPLANMGNRFRLAGALEPDRLVRAFDRVVRQCEVLRMVVQPVSIDGQGQPAAVGAEAASLAEPPGATEIIELHSDDPVTGDLQGTVHAC